MHPLFFVNFHLILIILQTIIVIITIVFLIIIIAFALPRYLQTFHIDTDQVQLLLKLKQPLCRNFPRVSASNF
jgi:hypothetical protein